MKVDRQKNLQPLPQASTFSIHYPHLLSLANHHQLYFLLLVLFPPFLHHFLKTLLLLSPNVFFKIHHLFLIPFSMPDKLFFCNEFPLHLLTCCFSFFLSYILVMKLTCSAKSFKFTLYFSLPSSKHNMVLPSSIHSTYP